MKIDQKLIDEYEQNGAVLLRGVFDPIWIDLIRNGIEKILADPSCYSEKLKGETGDGHYFDDYCNWQRIEEFKKFAFESPAAAIVGTLTKSKDKRSVLHKNPTEILFVPKQIIAKFKKILNSPYISDLNAELRPMSPYLKPLQQPHRLSAHGIYRTPPRVPVPDAMTATVPVAYLQTLP
ncbi:hypothetical protein AVEN_173548-1 [Araneus ventricosus]|uniref:Uncharacterized protein n=1 Tax=Araneus ventricosus TaxID=182803 RepID=A0A4Y2PYQ3_ARAVE|nr:hypothetical protein AVEN_173548-1 [Araneus ventricosus]